MIRSGIAAILGDVVVNPVNGLRDVADDGFHVDARQEPIVRGDEDIPLVHERLRLGMRLRLVTPLPAAAVNPEDHRQVLGVFRRVDVEHLTFVRRLGVGNVAFDVLAARRGHEGEREEELRGTGSYSGASHWCRASPAVSRGQPEPGRIGQGEKNFSRRGRRGQAGTQTLKACAEQGRLDLGYWFSTANRWRSASAFCQRTR